MVNIELLVMNTTDHTTVRSTIKLIEKKLTNKVFIKNDVDPYCCGVGNIITTDLLPKLYDATFDAKYFWVLNDNIFC